MQTPLRLTFRHMRKSAALEQRLREHLEDLERLHGQMTACDIVIGAPAGRHQHGEPFEIRIDLTLPDGDLHVGNDGAGDPARLEVYAAVRDAFAALERKLKRHVDGRQRQREHDSIRRHEPVSGG